MRALFLPLIFIILNEISLAQTETESNLEIFDEKISGEIERILYKPDLRRDIQFIFSVSSQTGREQETRFFNSIIRKTSERNKLRASFTKGEIISTDSVFNSVYINIIELRTKYRGFAKNTFLGSKLVNRNLTTLAVVSINGGNYDYTGIDTIRINHNDKVDIDDLDNIEAEDYIFTRGAKPRVSVYEEVVFPAAIIIVSVAASILFFTIRSK